MLTWVSDFVGLLSSFLKPIGVNGLDDQKLEAGAVGSGAVRERPIWHFSQRNVAFWPLVALTFSLVATAFFWQVAKKESESALRAEFERAASAIVDRFDSVLTTQLVILKGVQGLFATSAYVTRRDFRHYYEELDLAHLNSGFAALTYHEMVPERHLARHLESMQREGFPDYGVLPAGKRETYGPMIYVEPFHAKNTRVLGFDPLTNEVAREAIERARDTGSIAVSARLSLAQDGREKSPAFVMYAPLYLYGFSKATQALRRENFSGWVGMPYRWSELMLRLFPEGLGAVDLEIFDGTTKSAATLLYDSDGNSSFADEHSSRFKHDRPFELGGHVWTLSFRPLPEFGASSQKQKPYFVAIAGVLSSMLLAAFVGWMSLLQRRRIRAAVRLAQDAEAQIREEERRRQDHLLRESESRFRSIMENIPNIAVQAYSMDGTVTFWNQASVDLYGYSAEEAIGANLLDLIIPTEMRAEVTSAMELMKTTGHPIPAGELPLRTKSGSRIPVLSSHALVKHISGEFELFCLDTDLSEIREAEKQLRKLSLAVEQSPSSIVITDLDGRIEYVNDAFVQNTGYTREEALGQNPRILQSGKTPAQVYCELWQTLTQGKVWRGELHNKRKDGSLYTESAVIAPLHQPDGKISHYVAVKHDVTAWRAVEEKANVLTFFDPLTQLANRYLFSGRLEHAIAGFERTKKIGALLLIDLDHFKLVNDSLGHEKGDSLLLQVADRLSAIVRESDTLARIGGDDFALILENLGESAELSASRVQTIGGIILSALRAPYDLAGQTYTSSASIGVALFEHNRTPDSVFQQAELAVYQAKSAGRDQLHFFDPGMQESVAYRVALEADLRQAVEKRHLILHYQAQMTSEGRLIGAEVLLRWQHPERGMVSPADFISLAEDTGLIVPIGEWVLRTACAQLVQWAKQPGMSHLRLSVNVSAVQFKRPDFSREVLSIVEQEGANPERLKLELTESMLAKDVDDVIVKMSALRSMGVSFSLDDFGTGYSSLYYLKRLPLTELKIDQGFVRDILFDPNDAAIAKTIIALADSLGLAIIAEGVELEGQKNFLAAHGCNVYQGYYFSRPLPLGEFESFAVSRS